jgi:hypothetical protein
MHKVGKTKTRVITDFYETFNRPRQVEIMNFNSEYICSVSVISEFVFDNKKNETKPAVTSLPCYTLRP